jgi:uncharacterized protein (DUF885 family)
MNRKHLALTVALSLGLVACNQSNTTQTQKIDESSVITSVSESEKANALFKAYFDESMQMSPISATYVGINDYNDRFSPPINQQTLAESLAFEEKYLAKIKAIDASALSGQDLLSYEIFLQDREMTIKGAKFPGHLIPIHQMGGAHSYFASLGSGKSAQPFNTADDYRNFISRAKGFALYMDSAIEAMQEGIEKSIVLPKPLIEKVLPQLQLHMLDDITQSVFYGPLKTLKENKNITAAEKEQITQDYIATIKNVIIPAYSKVYDFMSKEYLPQGRDTFGLADLPSGKAWYEYRIETNTTLPLTAEEIHTFGQQEVARILAAFCQGL